VPRSDQRGVLMPDNQKIIVRIKAGGKEREKKKKVGLQLVFNLLFCGGFDFSEKFIKNYD